MTTETSKSDSVGNGNEVQKETSIGRAWHWANEKKISFLANMVTVFGSMIAIMVGGYVYLDDIVAKSVEKRSS
jgi:hypothetical protein